MEFLQSYGVRGQKKPAAFLRNIVGTGGFFKLLEAYKSSNYV